MIAFAYTECDLSIDDFFGLSWYEWSLEVEKVYKRNKEKHNEWEGQASLFRDLMAIVINSAGKVYKKHIDAKDILPLSFDKDEEVEQKNKMLTPEEVEKLHPKTLPKLKNRVK